MAQDALPVEFLFTITVPITVSALIANGPNGTRVVVDAPSGRFEGPKLSGEVKSPGGDWVTARADGTIGLDVRLILQTDDGAAILMQYKGVGQAGGAAIRTAPLFETGDERYLWLNSMQGVAIGASDGTKVTYDVYAVS